MENNTFIEFKRERDLGAIISDTFKFLRENLKQYFTFLVKIIGPILLIGTLLFIFAYYSYTKSTVGFAGMQNNVSSTSDLFDSVFGVFGWMFVLMLVGGLLYMLLAEVSLYYIKSYIKNNGRANYEEVRSDTYRNIWKFIGLGILTILMIAIGYVLCFLPAVYLGVVLTLAMPIMAFEDRSIGDTISHCFTLIRSEWWNSFGVILVIGFLVGILGFAFSVPSLIYQFVKAGVVFTENDPEAMFSLFSDPVKLTLDIISYIGRFLFYSITLIAYAFMYFDLNEQKNMSGTFERIDNLGNN